MELMRVNLGMRSTTVHPIMPAVTRHFLDTHHFMAIMPMTTFSIIRLVIFTVIVLATSNDMGAITAIMG